MPKHDEQSTQRGLLESMRSNQSKNSERHMEEQPPKIGGFDADRMSKSAYQLQRTNVAAL